MSGVYYYKILFVGGRARRGIIVTPYSQAHAAAAWIERRLDGVVVDLRRTPDFLVHFVRWSRRITGSTPSPKDLASMMRDIAVMSGSGMPLLEAFRTLADSSPSEASRAIIALSREMLEDLEAGASITEVFERQSDTFPETVRGLVAIGDASGTISPMLQECAEHLNRIIAMKSDVTQAMIYPAFSFAAIFGAAAFWIAVVMPNMIDLFKQMNAKLPPLTVTVLKGAEWLNKNWGYVAIAAAAALGVIIWLWRNDLWFRRQGYRLLHKLPVSRRLLSASGLAFLCEYLAILTRSGLDIVSSLKILEKSTSNLYYKDRIGAIRLYVERGDRISAAMRMVGGFPILMTRMIGVGESSGTMDRQLAYLASEYSLRLRQTVAIIGEIIKPLVVIVAGGVFLVLISALLLPVYDLVRQAMARPM
jgi:type II secretory pathway component PulF